MTTYADTSELAIMIGRWGGLNWSFLAYYLIPLIISSFYFFWKDIGSKLHITAAKKPDYATTSTTTFYYRHESAFGARILFIFFNLGPGESWPPLKTPLHSSIYPFAYA